MYLASADDAAVISRRISVSFPLVISHEKRQLPSSASSPASVDPCGGAVCGGPDHRLRLWSLFQTLDVNRDGGLCVNDLAVGLRRLGLHRTEGELRVGNADRSARAGKGPPVAPQHLREVQVTGLVCATGFSGSPLELGRLGGGLSGWLRPLDDRLGHPH